jgi:hypothetical protein
MKEYLDILGFPVKDRVTGFEGVAGTVGFDLYGCVQVIVSPVGVGEKGELKKSSWFDFSRLEKTSSARVMEPVPLRSLSIAPAAGGYDKPVR